MSDGTHWEGCWQVHLERAVARAQRLQVQLLTLSGELERRTIERDGAEAGERQWRIRAAEANDRADELEAEANWLREAQRWIPVSERLPEVGEKVQVVTVRPDGSRDIINDRYLGRGLWRLHDALGHRATHWRSLPPLPEEVGE